MTKTLKFTLTKKITLSILLIALSILLPQLFHVFGAAGTVFLPMHIPVLLAGFLLGPTYGLAIGAVSPIFSTYLTGMPAEFPMMPIMVFELATYGLISGLFAKHTKLPTVLSLFITMLAGRMSYGIAYMIIRQYFLPNISSNISPISAAITGIPGIIIQIVLITLIVKVIKKERK